MNECLIKAILVVDDAEVIRELLSDVLSNDGYQVDTAEDGKKAVEMVANIHYDMVFCDVHMPRQNGLQTARKIMKISPDTKVIMTDSYPDSSAETALAEGAVGCICKPFDLDELRLLMQELEKQIIADNASRKGKQISKQITPEY